MTYTFNIAFQETGAYLQALKALPRFYHGNLYTDSSLIDAYENEKRQALKNIQHFFVSRLSIYAVGEREKSNSSHKEKISDGYDGLRMSLNIGCHLNDVAPDIASAYFLNENQVLFMGHFSKDKAVNNSKGYQSVSFDEQGKVQKFAYINSNDILQRHHINDDVSPKLKAVISHLKTLTAPSYQEALQLLCDTHPECDKNLKGYLPKI